MRWSFVTPSRPSLQRARRAAVVVAMSAAAVATTTAVAPAPVSAAGVQLYASDNEYSTVINCTSIAMGTPLAEAGVGAYVGSYADPDAGLPAPNQTFYVEVYLAGLGDACGGHHVSVELMLPPGVSLNVTGSSPIECYIGGQTLIASECAQSMQASPFRPGALWYPSPDVGAARTWPLAQGGTWRFKFPVRSSIAQSTTVQAFLQVVDGWGNPTLRPTGPLAVFSNAGPSIVYATPSTKFTPVPNSVNFTTESTATVFKPTAQTGTIYFDIATNSNFSPVLFTDVGPVPAGLPAPEIYTDWVPPAGNTFSIQPNTTYYWRARYAPSAGAQITGATQRFTSPASGKKVVGNGTAASCTVAALSAAFTPYTERVDFDCGPLPVTIQLPDGYYTEGPLTIDGKGKVTLVAAPNLPIFIHQGGDLQLIGLTLTGGRTAGCGGAVQIVDGNAELTNMRLLDSRAQWGGGLCVMSGSTANVYNSYISGNVASGGGGGIYAGGNVYLRQTEVTNNTANSDGGGGVYSDAEVFEADYSTFAFNTANGAAYGRGGGLLFESATVGDIGTSTISGNTAVKGGGVHNEGDSWFTGVTIANNTATGAGRGGGIESETTGFTANLRFRNSIIANNVNSSSGTPVAANCASNSLYRLHTSNGNNLVSDFSCNFNTFGDLQNSDPKLRPLAWNGGPTRTHALPVSSPAVDTADNTYCGFYDQRGVNDGGTAQDIVTRWIDSDGNGSAICDRGAYELAAEPVFSPMTPARLMDTRPATGTTNPTTGLSTNTVVTVDGQAQNLGIRAGNTTTPLQVTGRVGVPGDAVAVSVNVTSVGATANGWVTLFPCGTPVPATSTLNFGPGAAVANAAVVPLGTDGRICVYTSTATNVIIDINGYMPASSKYSALPPQRVVDTRANGNTVDNQAKGAGPFVAGTTRTFQISGRGGVPAGTAAVVLNVTVPSAAADGYLTVFPCGTVPATSSLNVKAGTTVANAVFTGLSNTGTVCVQASAALNVIIDVNGAVPTGTTLAPLTPQRLLDSRPNAAQPADDGVNTVRVAGSVTEVLVAGRGGVSGAATTVALNVTAVQGAANGYLTVYPCDATRPNSSNLNYAAGVTRANLTLVKVPTSGPKAGRVCIFTSQQVHLLVDVSGQVT